VNQNPFVVEELRPINPNGQSTATYELSKASVSPSKVVGRDARGMPIEDTIPTTHWAPFLMLDGCINKVPLRTGSVFSMHADAVAYENETVTDLVTAGCIPAALCPYSTKYQHITHGPFARPLAGESDCGGSNGPLGCSHLQRIAAERQAGVLAKHNEDQERFSKMRDDEVKRMQDGIVAGVGEAIAKHVAGVPAAVEPAAPVSVSAAAERKQNLRNGKVDE
jgi:hypothetical protein